MPYLWLPLDVVSAFVPIAKAMGVSDVARTEGFVPQYRKARGDPNRMTDYWADRRDGFIKRHMAQVSLRSEPLWRDGAPSRRHLALIMWAYSPQPARILSWLEKNHGVRMD